VIFAWSRAMLYSKRGKWDATFAWVINPQREQYFWYSDPVFYNNTVFFYRQDNPISGEKWTL